MINDEDWEGSHDEISCEVVEVSEECIDLDEGL
jgi:hypothetical protein